MALPYPPVSIVQTRSTDHIDWMDSHTNILLALTISLDIPIEDLNAVAFESYENYFNETINQEGDWRQWTSTRPMFEVAFRTDIRDIIHILSAVLSSSPICRRADVTERFLLQQVPWSEVAEISKAGRRSWLDGLVDISLSLLLCVPVGADIPLVTDRAARPSVGMVAATWSESITFQDFVASQFPEPTSHYYGKVVLPPLLLKAVILERNFRIRVQWTNDFREHLSFDLAGRVLRVFALRYYITRLGERLVNFRFPMLITCHITYVQLLTGVQKHTNPSPKTDR